MMIDEATFLSKLGVTLRQSRKAKRLTQKQVAEGICVQSLISAIEHGQYLPNAMVFAQICQRLGLSMDQVGLARYPKIEAQQTLNNEIERLCNQHAYRALATYLSQPALQDQLLTDHDLAIFYYYRGVANFQTRQFAEAQKDLRLSLDLVAADDSLRPLILSASGCLNAQKDYWRLALRQFEQAQTLVSVLPYDENFNCVAYQLGLCQFKAGQYVAAKQTLQAGVQLITTQQSHYLLADTLVLLAACLDQLGDHATAKNAQAEGQMLATLFKLQLYQFDDE